MVAAILKDRAGQGKRRVGRLDCASALFKGKTLGAYLDRAKRASLGGRLFAVVFELFDKGGKPVPDLDLLPVLSVVAVGPRCARKRRRWHGQDGCKRNCQHCIFVHKIVL